jgi:RNA polymerase sigma factor (sigma-70 family)
VAERMLGSLWEADDAVQEAWLRLSRAEMSDVENLGGWLTTVVARICLNMLHARTSRREEPLDVHMPEPIVSRTDGTDPEHEALLADSVGLALLIVLDRLAPAERLAFVLHDIFGMPFAEIAKAVGRSSGHSPGRIPRRVRTVKSSACVAKNYPRSIEGAPDAQSPGRICRRSWRDWECRRLADRIKKHLSELLV